jgi:hypothetical protein
LSGASMRQNRRLLKYLPESFNTPMPNSSSQNDRPAANPHRPKQ